MYGKIFETIFDSSIMEEDIETRYVWHCMIVLADVDGNVDMTEEALARRINVTVSTVSTAVHRLTQPDPRSRSADEDGRRLILLDERRSWGWHLVNRERYRDIRSPLDRRDYFREQKRRKRAEIKMSTCGQSGQCGRSTASTKAEAEADIEEKTPPSEVRPASLDAGPPARKREKGDDSSPKKPPARYLSLDKGVSMLDRYPEIDNPETREALREFLEVAEGEGKALSAPAITQQLKVCRELGPARALAALRNSAQRRLSTVMEPFADQRRNGNGSSRGETRRFSRHEAEVLAEAQGQEVMRAGGSRAEAARRRPELFPDG